MAAQAGANYLGYILNCPTSPRYLPLPQAKNIIVGVRQLYPAVQHVGVLVGGDAGAAAALVRAVGIDTVQWYDCSLESIRQRVVTADIWPAVTLQQSADIEKLAKLVQSLADGDKVVLDAGKGSGRVIPPDVLTAALAVIPNAVEVVLAGGVTGDNIAKLLECFHPAVLDVNSGVEVLPGKKDKIKLLTFINQLKDLAA